MDVTYTYTYILNQTTVYAATYRLSVIHGGSANF